MNGEFAQLFEADIRQADMRIGALLMGTVVSINQEKAIVNVGLKSEGVISLDEFKNSDNELEIEEGDVVEVELKSIDDGLGNTLLSRIDAKRMTQWRALGYAMENNELITGTISGVVRGGLTMDMGAVQAFLPGSLVDVYPVRDLASLVGQSIEALIIKMDKAKHNIVISRKAVLQQGNAENIERLMDTLQAGQDHEGIVKTIVDYGAFIDLGGIDGLLHINDISWSRISHPSQILTEGEKVTVRILNFDKEKKRASLGLKQLSSDPWDELAVRLPIGSTVNAVVSKIADYGAFVRIEEGVEGLVHVSEMQWSSGNVKPSTLVKVGQEVSVVVLEIQQDKHRLSLSMKSAQDNPWDAFANTYSSGDILDVTIKSIAGFGLFVGLPGGIDGLVHQFDVADPKPSADELVANYNKGQNIEVIVLKISPKEKRISLGIKQLDDVSISSTQDDALRPTFGDILKSAKTDK